MKAVVRISLLIGVFVLGSKTAVGQDPDSAGVVQFIADSTLVFEDVELPPEVVAAPMPSTTKAAYSVVSVEHPETIELLISELFLTVTEAVTRLEFVDVTNNGFGPDDVVIIHPSQRTSSLGSALSYKAQFLMSRWSPESDFREDVGTGVSAEDYDPAYAGNDSLIVVDIAENAILSDVLLAVRRGYGDFGPINLLLQRDQAGFKFELWGYNKGLMQFRDKVVIPDTLTVFDLLYVSYSDSLIRADTTLYDLLYVTRTVQDTVYFPVGTTEMRPPSRNQPVNNRPSGDGNQSEGNDQGARQRSEILQPKPYPSRR